MCVAEDRKRLLQEKLDALNERLAEQRSQQDVEHLVQAFKAAIVSYDWCSDARPIFSWVVNTFNVNAWGWFDQSPQYTVEDFSPANTEESLALLKQLVAEHKLDPADRVYFLWVYGPGSAFSFTLAEVLELDIVRLLFETDCEFWLAEHTGKWCFIVHHEGTAHFAAKQHE